MKKIQLILTIILTLALSTVLIMFFDHERSVAKEIPMELYQVYLGSEKIGAIKSKEALEKYINDKQEEVKKKYHVDNVYPPNNLYIRKYIGYEEYILTEKEVYDLIKEKNPFTIKGRVFTIKKDKNNPIKVNVLDRKLFSNAVDTTVNAFVNADDYKLYKENKQPEIKTTGKRIENLIVRDITEKEAYIPVDEKIFIDQNELSKYLLFGTLDEQKKYTVQVGDTIENIAFDNKLGVQEFMIVNPQFTNSNNLLSPGQQVMVGLIKPLINVEVEQYIVEDITVKYKTETEYDSNMRYGTSYVKQKGVDGLQRVQEKIKFVNGEIIPPPDIKGTTALKYAINQIVVRGTKYSGGSVIVTSSGWAWPTRVPYVITSNYGWRWGRLHEGIDISGTGFGSPIYAIEDGVVYKTGYDSAMGNHVIIGHSNGYYSVYEHLSKIYAKTGNKVTQGQVVGAMGSTGKSTGTHLHLGIFTGIPYKAGSRSFNPLLLYK